MHNDRVVQLEQTPRSRSKLLLLGVLLLVALSMLAYRGLYRGFTAGTDFGLYYCSTIAMIQTGDPYSPEPLRELAEQRGAPTNAIENAIAPPVCYTPLLPFAAMPWEAARALWVLINLLAVFMLWYWLAGLAQIPRSHLSLSTLGLAAIVAGFAPLQTNIAYGQLAVTASASIIGSIAFAQQGRTRTAAVLFVLGGLLKPQLAIGFCLYWLYKREWRLLGYTACYGLGITLLTLGWLQIKNPMWYEAWQGNIQRLASGGGASDYARTASFIFSDLRVPLYVILQSRLLAAALAWVVTIGLGVLACTRVRLRPTKHRHKDAGNALHDLRAAGMIACLGMLPIYHVYYDTTILLLPAAWAIAIYAKNRAWPALLILLMIVPMLVPGQPLLHYLEGKGFLPGPLVATPFYRGFVLQHLPWLTIGIFLCLLAHRQAENPVE